MSPRLLLPFLVLTMACDLLQQDGTRRQPPPSTPLDEARTLFQQGQLDAALQKLQQLPANAESLYYQGAIWAKKAQTAPAPTPPPPPSPAPRGYKAPPPPEFKPEELRALDFFERAIAQDPEASNGYLGLAELLAPHAERVLVEREEAAKKPRRRAAAPTPTPEGIPDFSPERVLGSYQAAVRTAPGSEVAIYRLIDFAVRVGRIDAAEAAHLELYGLNKEDPERIVRYGDFLRDHKQDPQAAIDRYREAMIWRPDDPEIPARIAGIYIGFGEQLYERREFIGAEKNFQEASKYIKDWKSEQGLKVQDYLERFRRRNR